MFAVVYFFMIAPQMKRAKQEKKFASELKPGDKIVTKSGMYGKVFSINEKDTMSGKIKFDRGAISMESSKKLNTSSEV